MQNVSIITMTVYFVSFPFKQSEFDPGVFGMDVLCLVCSLMWSFLFCYFANLATDHVSAIGDVAYCLNWFDHPVEMQKYLILIVARSHDRIYFTGLDLIPCTIEVFGKVTKNVDIESYEYGFY